MKNLTLFATVILSAFILSITSCKNDDDSCNGIECLPPITQTGENTFGCLVNGEPLSVTNSREITAIYQGGVLQLGGGGRRRF